MERTVEEPGQGQQAGRIKKIPSEFTGSSNVVFVCTE